jgi:PGAP1-like protein
VGDAQPKRADAAAQHSELTASDGPAVLVVGGYLTWARLYRAMPPLLVARGATRVEIAPLGIRDWLAAMIVGVGPATSAVARSIDRLSAESGEGILVVGHSAGGILARLALASEPFDGARLARPDAVRAVVTLGTPHLATNAGGPIGYQGIRALRFLGRHPISSAGWLTVGATSFEQADAFGGRSVRWLRRALAVICYALLGSLRRGEPGDGMVPVRFAHLPGSEQVTLRASGHGPKFWGPRWHASREGLDEWWDRAVEIWRGEAGPTQGGSTIGP